MKKQKRIVFLCFICLACIGLLYLFMAGFKAEQDAKDASAFIYSTKEQALIDGLQKEFHEWKQVNLATDEADHKWTADRQKIAAEYSAEHAHYYLLYIDYSDKRRDYLEFFMAEVQEKENKFSFARISPFYELVPNGGKEKDDYPSGVVHSEVKASKLNAPLYFSCGKIKGTDRVYVDKEKFSNTKYSKILNVSVFGLLTRERCEIEVK